MAKAWMACPPRPGNTIWGNSTKRLPLYDQGRPTGSLEQVHPPGPAGHPGAWLGDARPGLEKLTRAACDDTLTDDEFRRMVADYLASGKLLKSLHPAALAEAMEHAMGTAAVIGKTSVPRV